MWDSVTLIVFCYSLVEWLSVVCTKCWLFFNKALLNSQHAHLNCSQFDFRYRKKVVSDYI